MAPIIGIGIGINRQYRVVTGGGPTPGPARTISSVVVGALSSFTLPVTITADAVNGETVRWVLVPTAAAAPTAANVAAGQANGGGAPTDAGSFTWPSGTVTLVSGIARANYDLYVVIDNGNLSNVGAPASDFEVDTTASLLTDEAFTDDGAEGVDGEFTANEAVSYRASLWPDGSTPSAAERESGTGSVATLTGTAAAATLETFNFPAVGDGIYVPTLWVQDDYGNEYSEIYADVTVAAASGVTRSLVLTDPGTSAQTTKTVNLSAMPSGARLLICINQISSNASNAVTAVTVQGDAATLRAQSGGQCPADIWEVVLSSAGSAAANIVVTRPTTIFWQLGVYRIEGTVTNRASATNAANSSSPIAANCNTGANGVVIAVGGGTSVDTPIWLGVTKDADTNGGASRKSSFASAATTTAETPRSISYDHTPVSGSEDAGVAVLALW